MTKISSGGGVLIDLATHRVARLGAAAGLGLSAFAVAAIAPGVFATGSTNGATRVEMEVSTSIAMKIQSPNDVDPDCIAEAGKTYGVANRYASSTGEGGKVVDAFNGNEGEADELNTNTSCAKLSMEPNTFDSTYSDVTVYTNSPSGYALTVQSAEGATPALTNTTDSTQTIPAGALTESNGTVAGGQNKWAYKTNNGIITDWTAATTSPAVIKSYDNYTEGGDTTRVTYGISTGNNPTGTYTTELTYTATMFDDTNPYVSKLSVPAVSNLTISADSLSIPFGKTATVTVTPVSGYYLSGVTCPEGFTCTGYSTDKSESASASAQTITVANNNTNTTGTLAFAVTKLAVPLSDLTTMQQMTPDTIAETEVGASKVLTDTRGGSYTVAKLADGNIWMTQNLNLYNKTLTPEDSDVSSNFTIPNSSTANWCTTNSAACDNRSVALYYSDNATSYGTYYNWYTATAGTGTYAITSGNATSSICPKGWKLPTGGASGQFKALDIAYGGTGENRTDATQRNKFMAAPLNFNYTGNVNGGSVYYPSVYACYWSRTANSESDAYYLDFDSTGGFYPQRTNFKWLGFSVRCVAAS